MYSLGVVLYELVTSSVPFRGESTLEVLHAHVHTPVPLATDLVPDALKPIVARMLATASAFPDAPADVEIAPEHVRRRHRTRPDREEIDPGSE